MDLPKRKPTRLKGYDYSTPGAYFITICTHNRIELLSRIIVGQGLAPAENQLTIYGNIAKEQIELLENRYNGIKIDKYVIMLNHIHMIIRIVDMSETEGINPFPATVRYDIPNVVDKYKAAVTRNVGNAFMHSACSPIWRAFFIPYIHL